MGHSMEKQYLSAEDAYNLIQDGTSVVSALAHTYSKDYYFGNETYPQCLRSGDIDLATMKRISDNWEVLTDYDIVTRWGYQKPNCCAYRLLRRGGNVSFDSLNRFLEENLTVKDYKNFEKNRKMVDKYFDWVCKGW